MTDLVETDERRRPGAHNAALRAFGLLREAGACYGFAATNTAANTHSACALFEHRAELEALAKLFGMRDHSGRE
ncbi:MAG TPA: hypothetical protein GX509_02410 [Firmicutes bacterium]|nr:hypothetical protein [Bacillota bacterium]HHY97574.1 hypothetical protein [Bacillota bacterium]